MRRLQPCLIVPTMVLWTLVSSAGLASAALLGQFVHDYGSVEITLRVYNGQPGGRYLWEYTVVNRTFNPNPGTSNGFSGFELFLPSPIPEIGDITPNAGSAIPWEVNCCSGNPVEWDRTNTDGNGIMPGESGVFSFTTDPRQIAINDSGWFHTWQDDTQTDIVPTIGMHVPLVPGLIPISESLAPVMSPVGLAAVAVLLAVCGTMVLRRRRTA